MRPTSVVRYAASLLAAIAILCAGASRASASPIYTADNGVPGDSAAFDPGNSALAGNYFTTLPGFNLIRSISVFWSDLPATPVTLGIVDDPNGDGSLSDGVVVRSFDVTPSASDVGTFVTYNFASTAVSTGFFVAAYIANGANGPGGVFPIPFDISGVTNGSRAFQDVGSFLTLAQEAQPFPTVPLAGEAGTWLIRADAVGPVTAVPEPSTFVLALIGLASARMARRGAR